MQVFNLTSKLEAAIIEERKEADTMKYWMVTCVRGHCGSGHETEITYAIAAHSLVHAFSIARKMPSVKHTRLPLRGHEITEQEFTEYRQISAYERYKSERSRRY